MADQEWMKFASTGRIQDYLSYKCQQGAGIVSGDAAASFRAGREQTGRSVEGYGKDHSADGHCTICGPGGGI